MCRSHLAHIHLLTYIGTFDKSVLAFLFFRLLTRMKGRSLLPRRLVSQQRVKTLLRRVAVVSLAASPLAVNQERRKRGMHVF